jgi:asparagine synthase (glutamine-hydrolysing)
MAAADGQVWLVFNGEIYNFAALRAELVQHGYQFRSQTDTEVIIAGYQQWGEAIISRLNGMFAFALWDNKAQKLLLARDRLGIKPLYYADTPAGFAFASEIKSLLTLGLDRQINFPALHQYLTFLWVPDPQTLFQGVYKLPPAHYLVYQNGQIQLTEYWDIKFQEETRSQDYWQEAVLETLRTAVTRQMISDVPLGAFLSGGVDSSSIVALMRQATNQPVHTYTVGFRSEDLAFDVISDDVRYARQMGKQLGTVYQESLIQPEVFELWPKLVWHMDEPVADPAIITSYLICRAARQTLTVLLSGMGGDEVFAGYPRHLAVRYADFYNWLPTGLARSVINCLPASRPGRFNALLRNLHKFAKSAALPFRERYLGYGTYFTNAEKAALYTPELAAQIGAADPYERHYHYYQKVQDEHWINQMLYLDLKLFLPCLNLTYSDKTSMASGLEMRVPYLDHELVELAARIPAGLKLHGTTQKYILKSALAKLLPANILHRKKAGFSAPLRAWLRRDFRPLVAELLSPARLQARGYFRPETVAQLIADNDQGRADNSLKIFQLLTLEIWQQTFLDDASKFN